jgi:uncharacterized SAM-binding protein YcdF (DUF218 family)
MSADLLVLPLLFLAAGWAAWLYRQRHNAIRGRRWHWAGVVVLVLLAGLLLPEAWVLRKTIGHLSLPLGAIWLALGLWTMTRPGWRVAVLPGLLWMAIGLLGSPPLAAALLAQLEAPYRDAAHEDPGQLEALVVLGGGTGPGADGRGQLGWSGDRLRRGAGLYHAGRAPLLVVTGASIPGVGNATPRNLAAEARHVLHEMGVPTEAIVLLDRPRTTNEECDALRTLVAERGWRRWGLCTSAWHLERALGLARRRGLDPVPVAADVRGEPPPWNCLALIPTGSDAADLQRAVWEYLGRVLVR